MNAVGALLLRDRARTIGTEMRRLLAEQTWSGVRRFTTSQSQLASRSKESKISWLYWPTTVVGGFALAGGAWIASSEHPASSAKLVTQFPVRLIRDVAAAVATVAGAVYQVLQRTCCEPQLVDVHQMKC